MKKFIILIFLGIATFVYAIPPSFLQMIGGECGYNDRFTDSNGNPPNSTLWTETDSGYMDIQLNKLNFADTGTTERISYITAKWNFSANASFGVTIDFDVTTLDAPDSGWNVVSLQCKNNDSSVKSRLYFGKTTNSDDYRVQGTTTSSTAVDDGAPTSGKLRLLMSSGTLKAYYWDSTQWEWNGNTAGFTFDEDFTDEIGVIIIYFAKQATAGSTTVDLNVDNFEVVSGCP